MRPNSSPTPNDIQGCRNYTLLNQSHFSGIALCVDNVAWNGAGQKIRKSSGNNNERRRVAVDIKWPNCTYNIPAVITRTQPHTAIQPTHCICTSLPMSCLGQFLSLCTCLTRSLRVSFSENIYGISFMGCLISGLSHSFLLFHFQTYHQKSK